MNQPSELIALGIVTLIPLIGLIILGRAILHIVRGRRRRSWPNTTGEIILSEVKVTNSFFKSLNGGGPNYDPEVRYRYKVNGMQYECSVISASQPPFSMGNQRHAEAKVDQYQAANKVDVYYNPNDPHEAVLETGISISGMLLLALAGIALLLCGLPPLLGLLLANKP